MLKKVGGGTTDYVIMVPLHDTYEKRKDNWPHSLGYGDYLSGALYRYGIINEKKHIMLKPDFSLYVNERYNIPYEFYSSGTVY